MSTLLKEINAGSASGVTWYLRLYEDSVSQSIEKNQSTVTLRLTLRASNTNYTISFDSRDAWIGSTHFTLAYSQSGTEHSLGSTKITVNHSADGTGSYSYSFGIKTSFALNNTGTGSRSLTVIPRASSIGSINGSVLGNEVTVNINRNSASFTHTVTYKFGSIARSYTGQGTACKFTPPLSDASAIPNSINGSATVTVQTYNGSTAVGSPTSKTFTLTLPTSVTPSISGPNVSRVDNGVPSAWGIYVKGFSKANISISGSGIYGSTIKSYGVNGGGYSSSSSSLATGTFNKAGTYTFTGTVTDSRGRTKSANASITVLDYHSPVISLTAERCNADGTINPDGVYVKAIPVFTISSVGKNALTTGKLEIVGTSNNKTISSSGNALILGGDLSIDKSYIIKATITDTLGQTSTVQASIPTGEVIMDIKANGKGIAFGKVAETDNLVDSTWGFRSRNGLQNIQNGVTTNIYSGNSTYTHYNTTALHWFNKNVYVQGDVYGGGSYNRRLAYSDETLTGYNGDIVSNGISGVGTYYRAIRIGNGAGSGDNYGLAINSNGELYVLLALNGGGWSAKQVYADSGWVNCSYATNWTVYGSTDKLQVRKIGKIVHMRGIIKNTAQIAASDTAVAAYLPSGFAPSAQVPAVMQGSGSNRFRLSVYSNGQICVGRYSNNTSINSIPANSWINISLTWFID